jgi:hypothetical protein
MQYLDYNRQAVVTIYWSDEIIAEQSIKKIAPKCVVNIAQCGSRTKAVECDCRLPDDTIVYDGISSNQNKIEHQDNFTDSISTSRVPYLKTKRPNNTRISVFWSYAGCILFN